MIHIEVVKNTQRKLFKQFIDYPNQLYKDCPYYIPYTFSDEMILLDERKNPSFNEYKAKYFLAYNDNKIVGRIGGLISYTYNKLSNSKRMRITRFDFINDIEVVKALLKAVEQFATEEEMDIVHGPFGFYDMDREGILASGFEFEATMATNYNYDYYLPLIKQCGYDVESQWVEQKVIVPDHLPDKLERVAVLAEKVKHLRVVKEKSTSQIIKKYAKGLFDVYDETYAVLPGAIPLTDDVRKQIVAQFKLILNKRYISIVLNDKDEAVAIGFCMPTLGKYFRKCHGKLNLTAIIGILREVAHPKNLEMGLIGVKKDWRNSGAIALVMKQILIGLQEDGIKFVETNPELVSNINVRSLWKDFEHEIIKTRETVIKQLKK